MKEGIEKNAQNLQYSEEGRDMPKLHEQVQEFATSQAELRESNSQLRREIAERTRIEQALRESEERLKAQYKGFPVPTYTWQMQAGDLVLIDYNDAAEHLTRGTIHNFLGTKLSGMYRNDPEIIADIISCYETHQTIQREMSYTLRSTAEEKVFFVSYVYVPPDLVMVHTQDITEQQQIKMRLERLNHLNESLFRPGTFGEKLKRITDGIVDIFGADFARIWIAEASDLCEQCIHARVAEDRHLCKNRDQCLHLVASSGRYTHINGEMHQRVPFGCYKIGQIATGEKLKLLTNDVTHDPRVHDHAWAKRFGLVSFAGYRLLSEKKTPIGVLALFSKHAISSEENSLLESLANTTSKVIQAIKAENALRESEERYKRLIEGSPDILYTFSDTRGSIYYSQRVNDILGYTPEYLRQYPMLWNSSIHPEDQPHVQQALEEFLRGKPFAIEYRIRNARGEWRWFYDRSIGRREEKGEILIEGLASDITERKQTEEALQLEKEKAQRYFDIAGVMLMVLNVDETVAQINERGCEILRLPSEYIVGENWFDTFLPDSCREQLRRGFRDFVSGEIPRQEDMRVSGNENPVVCSDGKERMILWHTSAIFAADGKSIVGILSSGEDITERKKAEEQLQHYVDELRGANAELSQYAYVVSHDLKAPLRAIHNYADFLREDLEDDLEDEQRTYLDHLQNAVVEANTLVNDILELSRIGRQETAVEVVNMDAFIDSVIKALNLARDVEIVMSPDWPVLATKPLLLRQIFQNLIVNGVKFNTSPRKRIELGWRLLEGGQYEFSVRDNGIGIELAHQEEIFRVFKRLHTKEEFEGTGVGLAIVKKAVGCLGGTIKIDSIPGKGSIFSLCIPGTIHS